ncbi:SMI1/KNR4 family protein [Flavobacterium lindanitolerans]|uniref:SMI1/KNR4 family protein SUKH-1 n=1 Tax=Flavobacterium lindanitolerans TaxID=428988 RepID=A0A497UWX0_9FLAO|nr:SMI1/KNR4 family protein [Flavobacterium lindanitolerans]PKW28987.1 SMI1/KNR4 family protein SUKH-1 [Flavobacterium lindanitolerans]RLJ35510.1 SMI1/KNR4 family protein SUKH-1 [Flavobacterium lindanitolerans]
MEILYLKKMEDFPKIGSYKNEGVSETEINNMEQSMNVKFPKAYREFLFLGGNYENLLSNWNRNFYDLDSAQEYAREAFQGVGLNMKPFWCFAEYNNANSSLFFFLDEGEDPPVYNFVADKVIVDDNGHEVFYKKTYQSFSAFIEKSITSALK